MLDAIRLNPKITAKELSEQFGCSITHGRNALLFARMHSAKVLELCRKGKVSESVVVECVRVCGSSAEDAILKGWRTAKDLGLPRVVRKLIPELQQHKLSARLTSSCVAALKSVLQDPGFNALSQETRKRVDKALGEIRVTRSARERSIQLRLEKQIKIKKTGAGTSRTTSKG